MKFGKQLQGTMVSEWADYYVDYKALKKHIKAISSSGAMPPVQVEQFVQLLSEQLDAVNMFFNTEQASVMAKWKTIDMLMIQAPTEAEKAIMTHWLKQRLQTSSSSGTGDTDISLPPGGVSATLKASKHQLSLFCNVYNAAQRLSQFVAINYVAFVKGMKKFEKRTALSVGHIFMPRLQRSVFFNSPSLAILLAEVDLSAKDLLLRLGCGGGEADILEEFRCSLCHELMRQPIVLACSHRFCWQCTAQASAVASTEGEWCCPTCRRPQVLNPEIYCVATSLSTLVERHMPSGANTRDGNLMEARKAATEALDNDHQQQRQQQEQLQQLQQLQQQEHRPSPRQMDGAAALLSAASDGVADKSMPGLPATFGYNSFMPGQSLDATGTSGAQAAAEAPTMAVALAVDPTNSIIASTKEQSYYDDLVTLADVELPSWPFEMHDDDLSEMLPEVETHDQPGMGQAMLHPMPQEADLASAPYNTVPMQLAPPDQHSNGMFSTSSMQPASSTANPKETGQKRNRWSDGNAAGSRKKRAHTPKKTLSEAELREKRMVAQRAYRQRMGRASELRKDFDVLRKDLQESQSKLFCYGQQLGDMLKALNWPPDLLQVLPTRAIAPGDRGPTPHQAAIAAATGAAMARAPGTSGTAAATGDA